MDESKNIRDIESIAPLALAYIGDSVFELFIREKLLASGTRKVNHLHSKGISYVSAKGQSFIVHQLINLELLTDKEKEIVRRGRNANPHTVAKNADISDYRYATGFESLLGYLYLNNEKERLNQLLEEAFIIVNKGDCCE